MTDYAKLITELEEWWNYEGTQPDELMRRAAAAIRELTASADDGVGDGRIPYKAIVELYNAAIRGSYLPPAKGLNAGRRRAIAARWQEDKERQSLDWWTNYFKRIMASDFLAGRTPPSPGHENWRPNLDWFIKPAKMTNILEGMYDNRGPRTNIDQIMRYR